MGLLMFDKSLSSDDYWIGKHIKKKDDERIEIRRSFNGSQLLIVVRKGRKDSDWRKNIEGYENVMISANGKIGMGYDIFLEMNAVVEEAINIVNGY